MKRVSRAGPEHTGGSRHRALKLLPSASARSLEDSSGLTVVARQGRWIVAFPEGFFVVPLVVGPRGVEHAPDLWMPSLDVATHQVQILVDDAATWLIVLGSATPLDPTRCLDWITRELNGSAPDELSTPMGAGWVIRTQALGGCGDA